MSPSPPTYSLIPIIRFELETLRLPIQQIAYQDFGIDHITIQMEQSLGGCTERHHFDHLTVRARP